MTLNKESNERLWDALIKEMLIESCNNELHQIESIMEKENSKLGFTDLFEKKNQKNLHVDKPPQ